MGMCSCFTHSLYLNFCLREYKYFAFISSLRYEDIGSHERSELAKQSGPIRIYGFVFSILILKFAADYTD
jgi:hypothetical protein